MPYRDVLVHVGGEDTPALAAAIDFARRQDARLIGLGIRRDVWTGLVGMEALPASAIEALERANDQDLADAKRRFDTTIERYGYAGHSEWRSGRGDLIDTISIHGRYADVVVVDQSDPEREPTSFGLAPELALTSGRPILIIPRTGAATTVPGEHVVVAWNASREAARAVADAMPLLQRARQVDVLAVTPPKQDQVPGMDIARHLASHDVRADVVVRELPAPDVPTEILNFISDRSADLLVMGCYGHARFHEMIFGGATRSILRSMTVPVLMSH
ncbi:universal stress protein [Mycobacterium sp. KBS0706]|uniref:universal stress protein n=1 Tax=Mycobacterium sp. KBS0706 TaxID=2578109 RepID=UPI00110F9792|nr:universal stress protein [Mycobacterium sp. KBS0706]TSD85457.1 universal stress protein [Mycobacterium sp. KBS0706]